MKVPNAPSKTSTRSLECVEERVGGAAGDGPRGIPRIRHGDRLRGRSLALPLEYGPGGRAGGSAPVRCRARASVDCPAGEGLHAQGRRRHDGAPVRRPGAQGRRGTRRVRRGRRGSQRPRAGPRRDRPRLRARRAPRAAAARAVRRRCRARDRDRQPVQAEARGLARDGRDGGAPRADHRRRHRALRPADGVRAPRARTASPPRSTSRAPWCAGPSGPVSRRRVPVGCRATARSCRTSTVSPISSTRSPAGKRVTSAPCASTEGVFVRMAPTIELVTTLRRRRPARRPGLLGPSARTGRGIVDDAIDGTLADFMEEADFDGKRGEVLAVPTAARLGARAALLLGVGDRASFDLAALRRAGAVLARRASKVTQRRDDVARRGRARRRPRRRRAGARRGRRSRELPVLALQVGGEAVALGACARGRARRREGARRPCSAERGSPRRWPGPAI